MRRILFLLIATFLLTSLCPKEEETYWVFCTATGAPSYASSCVQYHIDDYSSLIKTWKLAVREEVGSNYNERDYNFQVVTNECSMGNVRYGSKYDAMQGRDCYIRNKANKGISIQVIPLNY